MCSLNCKSIVYGRFDIIKWVFLMAFVFKTTNFINLSTFRAWHVYSIIILLYSKLLFVHLMTINHFLHSTLVHIFLLNRWYDKGISVFTVLMQKVFIENFLPIVVFDFDYSNLQLNRTWSMTFLERKSATITWQHGFCFVSIESLLISMWYLNCFWPILEL